MRRSILTTLQNQKSKIVLWGLIAISVLLLTRVAIKYIWPYKHIIATTSATKSANTLLQTVTESYNGSHSLSKLKIDEISAFDEGTSLNSGASIDFAVIAPGTSIPNGFEVIASLNEEKVVLVSHKGNHFEQLKDIGNATINIVHVNDYDEGVLRKLFDFFEATEQKNKINVISLDTFLESKISPNRVVYAFFLNPFSSTSQEIFKTRIPKLRDRLDVAEIDLAELADYSYLFFSSTIKKGELSIHPLLPSEDIDTVAAFTYLVARTSVSEEMIAKILTFLNASKKLILDKVSGDAFLNVEGISESKNIAFHRGYKKFLNGENEGFFQKNSDTIYILGVVLAAAFSFVYSNYKKRKRKADESHIGILAVLEDLEKDWCEELPNEDKQRVLKAKKVLSELIMHRSNKKNVLMSALIGFLVLTNLTNALRRRDDSYKDP
jgi:hypothetical protein